MESFLKNQLHQMIKFIFPNRCNLCDKFVDNEGFCSICWSKILWISKPRCEICGDPFDINTENICQSCINKKYFFDKSISVFKYDDFSKKIIIKFKHFDETRLNKQFAKLMYFSSKDEVNESNLIIPIPIHKIKMLKRKFNQSELLANQISKLSNIIYEPRILKKTKHTSSQEGLSSKKRQTNLKNSFGINKKYSEEINDKKIILVDDVFTTGSTLNECAKILKKNGAKKVICLTLAKVIL